MGDVLKSRFLLDNLHLTHRFVPGRGQIRPKHGMGPPGGKVDALASVVFEFDHRASLRPEKGERKPSEPQKVVEGGNGTSANF